MILLSHLLTGNSCDQYPAAANGSRSGNVGGIFHWPETIQHLLRTYATEQATTEALDELNDIHRNEN